jgi:hypothetical protein
MVLLPVDVGPSDCSLLVASRCTALATQPLCRTDIGPKDRVPNSTTSHLSGAILGATR